jgi:phosphoribosylglycinamide formyltransferase-1
LIDAIAGGRLTRIDCGRHFNREDAADWIARGRIEAICLSHRAFETRDAYDRALVRELRARDVGLVCLAGFMRLVGTPLIEAFPNRILNIHPSLLPAFPGLDAQKQAIDHGVKVSGVTVHLVTAELDGGPIVVQRAVPVIPGDTADSLAARILEEEHRAYPDAVRMILDGGWRVEGRRFVPARFPTSAST